MYAYIYIVRTNYIFTVYSDCINDIHIHLFQSKKDIYIEVQINTNGAN